MDVYGREAEIVAVESRLADRRLVTIVGPGGIGKTALAGAVAARQADSFPLGAANVDLTRIDAPAGVCEAIAGQLGYADFRSLLDSPGDRPVLLVVDNCEHVIDAAADAIDQMLDACRMPRIIATSRAPLEVPDESLVSLGPLPTPDRELEDVDTPSLTLLMERARDHGVMLGPRDRPLAAEICRRLDGVPLAIELAAARLRTSGPADVLAELDAAPHALGRRRFRGQPNHRSIADLVSWSYELLDADEQRVFVDLGVFGGPFTAELARSLLELDASSWDEVVDGLVAASLVTVDRSMETTRYRLLHPVRAVALDRLRRTGRAAELQSRLVDEICHRSLAIVRGGPEGWAPDNLHDLLGLYDVAAASIRWALAHDEHPDRAHTLVAVLWGVVHNAHAAEIHELGEAVLARWPEPSSRRWPHAAATVATCRFLAGDTDGAIALATSALDHAERSRAAPALLRRVIAQSRRAAGDTLGATEMFRAGADLAADRGAQGLFMELRVDEALGLAEGGRLDLALDLIDEMVAEAERQSAPINRAWASAARASVLRRRDGVGARSAIESALAESRSIGYPAGTTFTLRLLAATRIEEGETGAAALDVLELLDSLLVRGGLDEMRVVLDLAAELMRRHGVEGWPDVAATAERLPITSFITPTTLDILPPDRPDGEVMALRDTYSMVRDAMRGIASSAVVAAPSPAGAADDDRAACSPDTPSMIAEGEVWRLTFGGSTIQLKRSKGLDDLAVLLASPGVEVSALDLTGTTSSGNATEDELLDATARRHYEERIRELQADIEEAESRNDIGRSEQLAIEMDHLVEQLTAAVGLGGRSRRTSGTAERARSAVTQRLRSTIKRIGRHHPALSAHLDQRVSTGTYCAYVPDPPVTWRVSRR